MRQPRLQDTEGRAHIRRQRRAPPAVLPPKRPAARHAKATRVHVAPEAMSAAKWRLSAAQRVCSSQGSVQSMRASSSFGKSHNDSIGGRNDERGGSAHVLRAGRVVRFATTPPQDSRAPPAYAHPARLERLAFALPVAAPARGRAAPKSSTPPPLLPPPRAFAPRRAAQGAPRRWYRHGRGPRGCALQGGTCAACS